MKENDESTNRLSPLSFFSILRPSIPFHFPLTKTLLNDCQRERFLPMSGSASLFSPEKPMSTEAKWVIIKIWNVSKDFQKKREVNEAKEIVEWDKLDMREARLNDVDLLSRLKWVKF